MSLNAGIVGLPNVGKSTIFNALTRAGARVENFPFCTVDPNHGIVPIPDSRLDQLAQLLSPPKVVPATMEVVDIAGLVKGAHRGEGLGNQFLGQIRAVDAVLHVVRLFSGEVAHVEGEVDPVRDLEVVELELTLADLETAERRLEKISREIQVGVKTAREQEPFLRKFVEALREGTPLRALHLDPREISFANDLGLLTGKPVLYIANIDEAQLRAGAAPTGDVPALSALRERTGLRVVPLFAQMEAEIAQLDDLEERKLFLEDLGLEETGLDRLSREAYELLGLITFYTFVGGKELRAWSIPAGMSAPAAAGRIHTDFERGFIRAEVAAFQDFLAHGGESGARDRGLLRSEGKEYLIQDGDVVHFRFNV